MCPLDSFCLSHTHILCGVSCYCFLMLLIRFITTYQRTYLFIHFLLCFFFEISLTVSTFCVFISIRYICDFEYYKDTKYHFHLERIQKNQKIISKWASLHTDIERAHVLEKQLRIGFFLSGSTEKLFNNILDLFDD